jgi:enoyl-CoA hydratase
VIIVDEPAPRVRRITMNRPEKRNSLVHPLRGAILDTLRAHDADPHVSVTIIRGAGPSFSAGYDLGGGNEGEEMPYYTPGGEGAWPRHVTEGWMSIWDLAKPVIAQVHGYCLAGGSELAWPRTRRWGIPPFASASPTCTSTRGSSACARPWR